MRLPSQPGQYSKNFEQARSGELERELARISADAVRLKAELDLLSAGITPDMTAAIEAHDESVGAHDVAFDAHKAEVDPHTQYAYDSDLTGHEAAEDPHATATYTKANSAELITEQWKFDDGIVMPKTSGAGFKVDTTNETYPWHDLLGAISIRGTGATDPSYNIYRGGIRSYQFDPNEEVFVEFHMPHDYVPGSAIYIHFHHSLNGTTTTGVSAGTVTGGTVTWGAEVSYSKGHNQAAFSAPITTTVASATQSSTLYQHYISEVQLSATSPTASQLDSDDLEVDGLILVRAYLSANDITVSSGSVPDPFLHFVDIHYQSTGIGTKQKAPNFYV